MPASKRSYRVGNLRITRTTTPRARKHLNSPIAKAVGRKQLGFDASDVTLSMRKPLRLFGRPRNTKYNAKYDVRVVREGAQVMTIGFQGGVPFIAIGREAIEVPNPTKAEVRNLEKHALVHGMHIKLHDSHNIAFLPQSTLFVFQHNFFRMFQERKTWNKAKENKYKGENPFQATRRMMQKTIAGPEWMELLLHACATRFPTRRAFMDAIEYLYSTPSMRMPLLRLGHQMELTPENYNQTVRDFSELIDFLETESTRPIGMRRAPVRANHLYESE